MEKKTTFVLAPVGNRELRPAVVYTPSGMPIPSVASPSVTAAAPFVGIDFGTTTTMVAVYDPRKQAAIPQQLGRGRFELPTLIYGTEDGHVLFGDEAEDEGETDPLNLARRFKLKLGVEGPHGMGRMAKSAEELTTMFLRHVRSQLVNEVLHQPVLDVVLTVPAIFGPAQRHALSQAARAAGFQRVDLLDEPAAAGIAYCDHHQGMAEMRFLVVDWGGGTFDVALVERSPGREPHIVPEHVTGLDDIGGEVLDDHLWEMMNQSLGSKGHQSLNAQDRYHWGRYRRDITRAKERLSDVHKVNVSFVIDRGMPVRLDFERAALERSIEEPVHRAAVFVEQLVERCRAEGSAPDFILLAGGTARIPMIKLVFENRLRIECRPWSQGREAIAIGAALHSRARWGTSSDSHVRRGEFRAKSFLISIVASECIMQVLALVPRNDLPGIDFIRRDMPSDGFIEKTHYSTRYQVRIRNESGSRIQLVKVSLIPINLEQETLPVQIDEWDSNDFVDLRPLDFGVKTFAVGDRISFEARGHDPFDFEMTASHCVEVSGKRFLDQRFPCVMFLAKAASSPNFLLRVVNTTSDTLLVSEFESSAGCLSSPRRIAPKGQLDIGWLNIGRNLAAGDEFRMHLEYYGWIEGVAVWGGIRRQKGWRAGT